MTRDEAVEVSGDDAMLFADGLDDALIGVGVRCGQPPIAVYDRAKCIAVLARTMTEEEAEEHFVFNVEGAWVGDRTPMFVALGSVGGT